jgi:hypothetical protein
LSTSKIFDFLSPKVQEHKDFLIFILFSKSFYSLKLYNIMEKETKNTFLIVSVVCAAILIFLVVFYGKDFILNNLMKNGNSAQNKNLINNSKNVSNLECDSLHTQIKTEYSKLKALTCIRDIDCEIRNLTAPCSIRNVCGDSIKKNVNLYLLNFLSKEYSDKCADYEGQCKNYSCNNYKAVCINRVCDYTVLTG